MKIKYSDTPDQGDGSKLSDWKHKVYWSSLVDQRHDRAKVGMYQSIVYPGGAYCILKIEGNHVVYTYLKNNASRQFKAMQDLLEAAAPLEFEDE
jgi:hypothetical protein